MTENRKAGKGARKVGCFSERESAFFFCPRKKKKKGKCSHAEKHNNLTTARCLIVCSCVGECIQCLLALRELLAHFVL